MKHHSLYTFLSFVLGLLVLSSCQAPQDIVYLQDLRSTQRSATDLTLVKIQPGDQLSIVVNSRDMPLANIFNNYVFTKFTGDVKQQKYNIQTSVYTVDVDGTIDFPVLGKITVVGQTRAGVSEMIKQKIITGEYILDPVVNVDFAAFTISLLGEVSNPGKYSLSRERNTILDALSEAQDLTINGLRKDVLVLRENPDGSTMSYRVDLTDKALLESPAYYLQQNDVIYVSPNKLRRRQSTVVGNTVYTPTFWLSVMSILCSVTAVVYAFSK